MLLYAESSEDFPKFLYLEHLKSRKGWAEDFSRTVWLSRCRWVKNSRRANDRRARLRECILRRELVPRQFLAYFMQVIKVREIIV